MTNPSRARSRQRRVAGWGLVGESYPPSEELLAWLGERIGVTRPQETADLRGVRLPGPRALPDLGIRFSSQDLDRLANSRGQGLPDILRLRTGTVTALPDIVVCPASAGEVETLLRRAAEQDVRLIPRGGGSSVTGGVNVTAGDRPVAAIDLAGLSGLEGLDAESGLATFGAGTRGPDIEAALEPAGLTLGHFPQSWEFSTLGGWVVTRSSGQESLGYGRIEDMVAGLELIAPAGRLSLPALPASAAGPDLRSLVMGSEGRLGIVTRATVRVRPRPPRFAVEAALLPSWEAGLAAARSLVRERAPLHLLRLSDRPETEVAMAVGLARQRFTPLVPLLEGWLAWRGIRRGCLVLCGTGGDERGMRRAFGYSRGILKRFGAVSLGRRPGRRWRAERFRHPYLRDALLDLGIATDTLETAAPWSRLEELAASVRKALESALEEENERVAALCHLSHPYPDGASLYFTFFFRATDDPEKTIERWATVKRKATAALVAGGGALSHHHGVGQWHSPWLEREVGADGLRILEGAARLMDPQGILNTHVLLDAADRLQA